MNKINIKVGKVMPSYKMGSIWKSIVGNYYILASYDGKWVAIGLSSGTYYRAEKRSAMEAVSDLEFMAEKVKITIEAND